MMRMLDAIEGRCGAVRCGQDEGVGKKTAVSKWCERRLWCLVSLGRWELGTRGQVR